MMDFEKVEYIQSDGFCGFLTVAALQDLACRDVPAEQGIYLILWPGNLRPVFLENSVGGHFKGRDPTVSAAELRRAWVAGSAVLYIGKAGGPNTRASLKSRLRQYMQFGQGKPVGHWGGRYIWQLQGVTDLIVCWKPTPDRNPRDVEVQLIDEFKRRNGKRPFANLRD